MQGQRIHKHTDSIRQTDIGTAVADGRHIDVACGGIAGNGIIDGTQEQMGRGDAQRMAKLLNALHVNGEDSLTRMAFVFRPLQV